MTQNPYSSPATAVRDSAPSHGFLPAIAAIVVGVLVVKFLTMVVSELVLSLFIDLLEIDMSSELTLLWGDLVMTYLFAAVGFWFAWRLSRTRRFPVPFAVAAITLAITMAHRWIFNDFGWPLWYEIALLLITPLALLHVYIIYRRENVSA